MAALVRAPARHARSVLLVVSGLVAIGALLVMVGMPLAGWLTYGLGHLGLLLAVPAIWLVYRASMERLTVVGLAIAFIGVVVGIPVVFMLAGYHLENPTVRDALLGHQLSGLGALAGVITWIGFAFFGIAAYRVRAVPVGGAVTFVIGAIVALAAELGVLALPAWALGVIIVAFGLAWIASPDEGPSIP